VEEDILRQLLTLAGKSISSPLYAEMFLMLLRLQDELSGRPLSNKIVNTVFQKYLKEVLNASSNRRWLQFTINKPVAFVSYGYADPNFKDFVEKEYIENFLERILQINCIYSERDLRGNAAPGHQIIDRSGLITKSSILVAFCTKDIRSKKVLSKRKTKTVFYPSENVTGEIHAAKIAGLNKMLIFCEKDTCVPSNIATAAS
jgi:hypothetical protein